MATATQRTNFRLDLGLADDETVFTSAEIDAIFTRAEAKHSTVEVYEAYALVLGARQMRNKTASLADYKQNESSESLSQIFKNLDALYKDVYGAYTAAVKANTPTMRIATLKRKPAVKNEYPDA